ncbi:MAG: MgtC/SapB family protein [Bdellovibrionales bacterium]|jgi:putative Mg2+ transporter-C (MgtC) family protein|nr:MgtC/SapB family protein [Bdellovibrionales bacterium]
MDTTIYIEHLGYINEYFALGIQIITAFLLGGAIGIDRQKKLKPAGIKTNMLICIGSTLYTAVSLMMIEKTGGMADPNRVAAQVVSGIGFLGAGAIMKGGLGIVGLTTAATIWVVAAVGVTIGMGYPVVAGIFTLTILIILKILGPVYELFEIPHNFFVEVLAQGDCESLLKQAISTELEVKKVDIIKDEYDLEKNLYLYTFQITLNSKKITNLVKLINEYIQVKRVNHFNISNTGDERDID